VKGLVKVLITGRTDGAVLKRVSPRALRRMQERLLSSAGIEVNELGEADVTIDFGDRKITLRRAKVVQVEGPIGRMYQLLGGEEVSGEAVTTAQEAQQEVEVSEEDVALVAAQAGVSEEEARRALIEAGGDLAKAILSLRSSGRSG
jgi:nascent polypeptide-associated complex subunit alpha